MVIQKRREGDDAVGGGNGDLERRKKNAGTGEGEGENAEDGKEENEIGQLNGPDLCFITKLLIIIIIIILYSKIMSTTPFY